MLKSLKNSVRCALGYGELSTLSVEDRIRVEDEAERYVEQWEETVEMTTGPTIRPMTPLRSLLAEYHEGKATLTRLRYELDEGVLLYGISVHTKPRKATE